MSDLIDLEVISSTDTGFKTTISEVYIPAFFGEAGILKNHLPYMSILNCGEICYQDESSKKHYLFIREGFIEVLENKVTIISDSLLRGEDLPEKEIENRLIHLNNQIKSSLKGELDPDELDKVLQEKRELEIQQKIVKKI